MNVPASAPGGATASDAADEALRLRGALELLLGQQAQLGADVVERAAQPLRLRLRVLAGSTAAAAPRLRQVSVLFVDIVDSTRLLQTLDAEDSHAVLDGALRRFADVVHAHGGQVLRFMGDGLKAAFGLPEPADDDALRAVRAARAVLEAALGHAAALRARLRDLPFAVRAGLHNGPVALGAGAEDAQTLVGATVHLAARLEQAALPGTLLVSRDTWRATRGAFEYLARAPLLVKGVADPVLTYQLVGERASGQRLSGRGIDGLDAGLVGREAPLAVLAAAVRALAPGTPGAWLTVLGEAGVGKSRLRQALLQDVAHLGSVQVLPAQSWPETERAPWGLLRDLLLRHVGLSGREPPAHAAAQFRAALLPLLHEGAVTALAYAVSVLDTPAVQDTGLTTNPGALRQAVQQASLGWLRGLLQRGPVLLLLDDLHWADDGGLDLLAFWRQELAGQPLGVVALARPDLLTRRPGWPTDGPHARSIGLEALDADAAQSLVDALLGRMQPVPPALRDALLARSGGNPYFIEELIGMLIDRGALDVGGEVWHWRGDVDALQQLPGTLAGVLQSRVRHLGDAERLALQQAAVVGPHFTDPALAAIDPQAALAMPALQALGLVWPEPGGAWRFHHQLLQQAAYDSVLKRDRQPWHARVAAHLVAREDSPAHGVASHYERAGDITAAVAHYRRAALGPPGRTARTELRHAARRALALAPDADARTRWPLHLLEATVSLLLGEHEAMHEPGAALHAAAEALDDDGLRAEAARLALCARQQELEPEHMAAVVDLAERAHARYPGERLPRMLGLHAWAMVTKGRAGEARRVAERALDLSARAGLEPAREAMESAGIAAWKLGDLSAGLNHMLALRELARARGDPASAIPPLVNLAGMARTLGDRTTWQEALDEAKVLMDRTGLVFPLALWRVRKAQLRVLDGEVDAALAELARALSQLPASDRWFRITVLLATGHARLARAAAGGTGADAPAARQAFEEALAGAVDAGMRAEAREGLVHAALAEGDAVAAAAHADALLAAMADPEPGDATERPAQWLAVADARRFAGDAQRAAQALATAAHEVREQASRISDPTARARFLTEVPHNRRIGQLADAV